MYFSDIQLYRRVINAAIELGRARLLLDQGKDEEADTALGKAPAVISCENDLSAVERAVFSD